MQDARIRNVIVALVAALVLLSGGILYGRRQTQSPVVITGAEPASPDPTLGAPDSTGAPAMPTNFGTDQSTDATVQTAASTKTGPGMIYIHVAGAVKHPDLYEVPDGTRVAGAIKAAGGAAADADIDAVNLAEKVVDGEKVYIPHKGETGVTVAPPGNSIGYGSSMPSESSPTIDTTDTTDTHTSSSSGHGHASNKLTDPSQGKVDINTASAEELERLPGVGPATAARIIAYRQQNGAFKSPDGLKDVGGIGDKKMAKLAPFITVR